MRFSDIIGLEDTKNTLKQAIASEHIAHAQLFMGKPGSAGLPMALAYANSLVCDNPTNGESCGKCPSCNKSTKFIHPDIHFIFPVSGTKDVQPKDAVSSKFLPQWREFLKENPYGLLEDWSSSYGGENKNVNISKEESRNIIRDLSLKAFEGKYKVMIIWLPEYLHPFAANAILKILEEPPEKTVFLLVTNDYEKLLSTILSRTQTFKIPDFSTRELGNYLQQEMGLSEDNALNIASMADGSLGQAIHLSQHVEDNIHDLFRNWMRVCYTPELLKMTSETEDFSKLNKTAQRNLFQYGLNILRESLVSKSSDSIPLKLEGEDAKFVKNFSKVLTIKKIEGLSKEFNASIYHLERNANPKIVFMDTSLRVMEVLRNE